MALLLVPATVSTGLYLAPPTSDRGAMLTAFVPYGLLGYPSALVLLVLLWLVASRRRLVGLTAIPVVVGTALALWWQAPAFIPARHQTRTPPIAVMSLNVNDGLADPAAIVARAQSADLVVLVETQGPDLDALDARGWRQRFPYVIGDPREVPSATTVFSRFPLVAPAPVGPDPLRQWRVDLSPPGMGPIQLIAAHPCNPYCNGRWSAEQAALTDAIEQARTRGPLIVAGDFNAVPDHASMRRLRRAGMRDAADLAGAGWQPTWPTDRRYPALLPIDHVLVSPELTATAFGTFPVPGTDHRGVQATLARRG